MDRTHQSLDVRTPLINADADDHGTGDEYEHEHGHNYGSVGSGRGGAIDHPLSGSGAGPASADDMYQRPIGRMERKTGAGADGGHLIVAGRSNVDADMDAHARVRFKEGVWNWSWKSISDPTKPFFGRFWKVVWTLMFSWTAASLAFWLPNIYWHEINMTDFALNVSGAGIIAVVTAFEQVKFQYLQTYFMYGAIKSGYCSVWTSFGNLIEDTDRLFYYGQWWYAPLHLFGTLLCAFIAYQLGRLLALKWKAGASFSLALMKMETEDRRLAYEIDVQIRESRETRFRQAVRSDTSAGSMQLVVDQIGEGEGEGAGGMESEGDPGRLRVQSDLGGGGGGGGVPVREVRVDSTATDGGAPSDISVNSRRVRVAGVTRDRSDSIPVKMKAKRRFRMPFDAGLWKQIRSKPAPASATATATVPDDGSIQVHAISKHHHSHSDASVRDSSPLAVAQLRRAHGPGQEFSSVAHAPLSILKDHIETQEAKMRRHTSPLLQGRHWKILATLAVTVAASTVLCGVVGPPDDSGRGRGFWMGYVGIQDRLFEMVVSVVWSILGAFVGTYVGASQRVLNSVQWGTFRVNIISCILIAVAHNALIFRHYFAGDSAVFVIIVQRFIIDFCGSESGFSTIIDDTTTLYNSLTVPKKVAARNLFYNLFLGLIVFLVVVYYLRVVYFFQ